MTTHPMTNESANVLDTGLAASSQTGDQFGEDLRGELLYEYRGRLTGVTDYGVSMEDVLTGRAAPPPSGLRVDIAFEGEVTGPLPGYIKGVDYLNIRADGRMELDIKATLTTPSGERIAVYADGVGLPQPNSTASLLRENVELTTAHPEYAWLNGLQIWATGVADVADGTLHVRGYLPSSR